MPECMFFTKHKDGKTSLGLSFSESKETDEGLCKQISTTFLDMTFFQMKKKVLFSANLTTEEENNKLFCN